MLDFNIKETYPKNIQDIIDKVEKEIGTQVIKVKTWSLPISEYSININFNKLKTLNIVEEFIIKIALSGISENITSDTIKSILGLDKIFIDKSLDKLSNNGMIDESELPKVIITNKGKEQYEQGKIVALEKVENIKIYCNKKFNLFYSNISEEDLGYTNLELDSIENLQLKDIESELDVLDEIINIGKENAIILSKESFEQSITEVSSIEEINSNLSANYLELWIYDIIDDKLYCRVWDYESNKYRTQLSEYITNTNQLSISDFEIQEEAKIQNSNQMTHSKYEDKFIEEIKEKRKNNDINETTLRMVRGADIKKEFDKCLQSAENYLYIQSPWISKNVVDESMINIFKKLVSKGCKIFISWGISRSIEKEDRKPDSSLLKEIKGIKNKDGLPGVFIYWIGNHHDKEIIVDNKSHLVGSFNWLSYRGDYLPRGESVYITDKKEAIQEAKVYWEEQIFNKICEDIFNDDYIMNINALINLSTKIDNVDNVVIEEIKKLFIDNIEIESINKLYNLVLIYLKNKVFNDVFTTSLDILISNNAYLRECYTILNYIKVNENNEIYETIMSKYIDKFIEFKIINDKNELIDEVSIARNIDKLVIMY